MTQTLRESTLRTLGLGTVIDIFKRGALPASAADLVDRVFGPSGDRGSLLISGANGGVGAGKTAQLGSRLEPHGVPVAALDFPSAPDGIGREYPGLVAAFGREASARIMADVIRFHYDGKNLPPQIAALKPRFGQARPLRGLARCLPRHRHGDAHPDARGRSGGAALDRLDHQRLSSAVLQNARSRGSAT
jgi:hypothetical protein